MSGADVDVVKAIAKYVPAAAMSVVEGACVPTKEVPHPVADGAVITPHHQVDVIPHKAIPKARPFPPLARSAEPHEEPLAVLAIEKD